MAYLLGCENIQLEYPTARLFDSLTLGVNSGDRIGIVGRNGDGKSTLLKLLAGEASPDDGRVVRTGNVTVGMLAQKDALDDDDVVGHAIVGDRPEYEWAGDARVRAVLAHLVSDLDWNAEIGTLSGGQRRRVDLARVLIGDYDVLMMDEPTNHLDIDSREWIEEAVEAYDGTLLFVSHDRYFINRFATRIWEVANGTITDYPMGFAQYRQVKAQEEAEKTEAPKPVKEKTVTEKPVRGDRAQQAARRQLTICEREIAKAEERIGALDAEMEANACDYEKLNALVADKDAAQAELDALYLRWEELSEAAGEA